MRIQDVPQKGKRGKIVASRNRFGQYLRQHVSPKQPGTTAQRAVWANMAELSWLWNHLSEQRRQAWCELGLEAESRRSLGQSGPLGGILLFKKLNSVLQICGREVLLDPPPPPAFGPNPVAGFAVGKHRGGLALKVKLSPDFCWEDRPPLEDLMVFAWAPCNAGVAKNSLYAFLGLLPRPTNGQSNITELYLTKLKQWRKLKHQRYHIPLAGSRIFIRVWQQVNGWENELGMFRANALTPDREWPSYPGKKAEK